MTKEKKEAELLSLIRRCKRYDRSAQFEIYRRFHRFGIGICLRYAKTEEDAQEMLNEAFYRIFTKIKQYDEQYTFVAWARTIFIHTAIDELRKQKHDLNTEEATEKHDKLITDEMVDWMNAQEVAFLVRQLPPQYRAVYNLHEVEGYEHQEIGKMLNISTGTSKSNLARARKKLEGIVYDYLKQSDLKEL
ncbi:MAG: sigma-70 family RNA polymerase sigma factor [Saprospiraceae bacterium]|nr:MAG: sigma-70 family RNA polymerase sigma factor [Saprospiraceae bacterium]